MIKRLLGQFKKHENYKELIWMLAKTDFKLRYQGSVLGYFWVILSPLMMFLILNFVFSSVFSRGAGVENYSLQLITGIIIFSFFNEGTKSGMGSLVTKSQLVTKIYVPRWSIILASTLNAALFFLMNLIVLAAFFIFYGVIPSIGAILFFIYFIFLNYLIILGFSFVAAPLYVKFRDALMIWEVVTTMLFYATPIVYPLYIIPEHIRQVVLLNPLAFIVHFIKEALVSNHFPELWQVVIFSFSIFLFFGVCLFISKKLVRRIAEEI